MPVVLYQCKRCGAQKQLPDDVLVHSVTWCGCCPVQHDHGASVLDAGACAAQNHPGQPCWNPPEQPVRPAACTVCRPIVKFVEAELFGTGVQ